MTGVEIRLPELTGGTEAEQLRKIQSYLFTLAQQLQYAFDGVSRAEAAVPAPSGASGGGAERLEGLAAVKSLILRSADIAEHFSEEITRRLAGKYVAVSQFGTFTQETEQKITASAEGLRQEFGNFQRMETELESLKSALLEVNATIRTGLLYEDANGTPVYGLEIGQQTRENGVVLFRKFARLTADRLSFFDANDVEVAYISDRTLYITAANVAEFTTEAAAIGRLTMGDYIWQIGADGHLSVR